MNFTSLDFETANRSRLSICAAGVAVFTDGQLTETPYWLVRPPKGHSWFDEDFTDIHGITHQDVITAPEFPAIEMEILPHLVGTDLVIAHNAAFDIGHLQAVLEHFDLPRPAFEYACTCQLSRRVWPGLPSHGLKALTAHIGHQFNHHHAQSDAEAAGRVLLAMMAHAKAGTPRELLKMVGLEPKRFR